MTGFAEVHIHLDDTLFMAQIQEDTYVQPEFIIFLKNHNLGSLKYEVQKVGTI